MAGLVGVAADQHAGWYAGRVVGEAGQDDARPVGLVGQVTQLVDVVDDGQRRAM